MISRATLNNARTNSKLSVFAKGKERDASAEEEDTRQDEALSDVPETVGKLAVD